MTQSPEISKTVAVIGTSGAVGMATRDYLSEYLGLDVIAYDRAITGTPEQIAKKEADREKKIKSYEQIRSHGGKLLDGEQAQWLLGDTKKLEPSEQGRVTNSTDLKQAIDGAGMLVITAGMPRKVGMDRADVAKVNTPIFEKYGNDIADIVAENITNDETFELPVIVNAGNPADTMTEVLSRTIYTRLREHVGRIAKLQNAQDVTPEEKAHYETVKTNLEKAADQVSHKIIGQGGVLDGARAATAIHEIMKIPLADIIETPVLGTHNDRLRIDFDKVIVRHEGQEIPLSQYPGIDLKAPFEGGKLSFADEIERRTRIGGGRILTEYKKVFDIDQSAILATGVANMKMVDAITKNKNTEMSCIVYHIPEENKTNGRDMGNGFLMGAAATLGSDGATYQEPSPEMAKKLMITSLNAVTDYDGVSPHDITTAHRRQKLLPKSLHEAQDDNTAVGRLNRSALDALKGR